MSACPSDEMIPLLRSVPTGPPAFQASLEDDLVDGLKAGDEDAVALLIKENAGSLLATARRFLRNEEDARDAVQDAFIKAYRSIATFNGSARVSTWLHRILINGCLMRLRTRRRKPEESIEPLLPCYLEDGHTSQPYFEWPECITKDLERRELRQLVREKIAELPESYRTVLLLRDIEEVDTAEAARILDCTENAVKIRLHRARQALRTLLDPHLAGTAGRPC